MDFLFTAVGTSSKVRLQKKKWDRDVGRSATISKNTLFKKNAGMKKKKKKVVRPTIIFSFNVL